MDSETPQRLPAIDFSELELNPGSHAWNTVKAQVHQAFEGYGCFEATFDKFPSELRKAIFSSLEELFDLPLQTKVTTYSSKKPYHGYIGQIPVVPLFESMGIEDAPILEKAQSFTNLLWHEGNPNFCNTVQSFSEQVRKLDQMIRRMVLESLGLEKYIDEHIDSTKSLLRCMKYKGPQTTDNKIGLLAHTDKTLMTILCGNEVEGLEVQTKSGEWIKVKPSPDSFTVMTGDSLYAWTNGRLYSPFHRVMLSGNEVRYSVAHFSMPKEGYIIKTPDELVDQDYPLLFKPFDYNQFIQFFHSEAGRRAQCALKAFCGV